MHIVRGLSIIGLAVYLVFQGIFYMVDIEGPVPPIAIGLVSLFTGVLMFISLGHWLCCDTRRK
jgi:hypothetical protein